MAAPCKVVGNHHPIFLNIPTAREKAPPFIRRLKIDHVKDEDWEERNMLTKKEVTKSSLQHEEYTLVNNATKLHQSLRGIIWMVVGDLYTRKPPQECPVKTLQDPFELLKTLVKT